MMITAIIVFVLATIIIAVSPRNASLRWLSAAFYATGCSALIAYLDSVYPDQPYILLNSLNFAADAAIAFTFGMFGIEYSGLVSKKQKTMVMASTVMFFLVVCLLTPLAPSRYINYEGIHGLPMVVLQSIAMLASTILLLVASKQEKHPYKRIERLITNLIIIPTMLFILAFYIFTLLGIDLWQYNYILAIVVLLLFLGIGIKQGALGVKIKISMMRDDATLHVIRGGSNLLNHTLKNELGKIDILLHQLQHIIQDIAPLDATKHIETKEMVSLAAESVHHIQSMMAKIDDRVQSIEVNLEKDNLLRVTEQCLEAWQKTVGVQLSLIRDFKSVSDSYFDHLHIKEVIFNLLNNAAESMDWYGEIKVALNETSKGVVLQITDSGKGIPRDVLPSIFEPFFSTKSMKNHYGLGLFYCKNVMVKHRGTIFAENMPSKGAKFTIQLPK